MVAVYSQTRQEKWSNTFFDMAGLNNFLKVRSDLIPSFVNSCFIFARLFKRHAKEFKLLVYFKCIQPLIWFAEMYLDHMVVNSNRI